VSELAKRIGELSPKRLALLALDLQSRLDAIERSKTEPIAIIGIGCRFPGRGNDPESFWQVLRDGIDPITEVPQDRWDVEAYYDPNPNTHGKTYTRFGGFLEEVDKFDAEFFGIDAQEAVSMDPQQRLLLEVTWEALENAGQAPQRLVGSRTSVFVGIGTSDYTMLQLKSGATGIDCYTGYGNGFCYAAGRVSYVLGLQGPSMAIDAACASSLVAVHLACQSLRSEECNLAVAGGVNLILSPETNIIVSKTRRISAVGRCMTFDAAADGYVRSEGCGVVVLKRLSDAAADGDDILALIRGSAVNHAGASGGLTIPNGLAQRAVIHEALVKAGVKAAEVGYVEVQGTGTPVGDPIEVRALAGVLSEGRSPDKPLALGSVKTNIGNLETASGMASLIKIVLAMQHRELPPHLHLRQLNPEIVLDEIPAWIPMKRTAWPTGGEKCIAGVNCFGANGTNAHLVVAEPPPREPRSATSERPLHLLSLSAKNERSLKELARRFQRFLEAHPFASLGDVCYSAGAGRSHFDHRIAFISKSSTLMHEQVAAFAQHGDTTMRPVRKAARPKVAFVFTGYGSEYVGMGLQLYETQPTFRQTLNDCDRLLRSHLGVPLVSVLYPNTHAASSLSETAFAHVALFSVEYALAKVWQSWGIRPDIVIGHGVGEYAAACIAGVFSLEECLGLVAKEGQLIQGLPPNGMMAAVFTDEIRLVNAIASYSKRISIAAVNGLGQTIISGERSAVMELLEQLRSEGIDALPLKGNHAFHSSLMEPILDSFVSAAQPVKFAAPNLPMISNLTGQVLKQGYIPAGDYWRRRIIEPVQFGIGIRTLLQQGYNCFLELGPKSTLLELNQEDPSRRMEVCLSSIDPQRDDWETLLDSLKTLYLLGLDVDWRGFDHGYCRQRIPLPTYPFERRRYWFATDGNGA
jgi:acyl transferase domain-containing protein